MSELRELAVYPRFVVRVLPLVERELRRWSVMARAIPDAELGAQALASIEKKKFHCSGGSVLALLNRDRIPELVQAIVAIQTISDYLDNLCDRSVARPAGSPGGLERGANASRSPGGLQSVTNASVSLPGRDALAAPACEGFRTYMLLHEAMLCAVDPIRPTADYYAEYGKVGGPPAPRDGGYLDRLVQAARQTLRDLPGYQVAKPLVLDLVRLYSELQSIKHLSPTVRDSLMEQWFRDRWGGGPALGLIGAAGHRSDRLKRDLKWWEFGAAAGSTLGMFALICASGDGNLTPDVAEALTAAYFPAICGLHILLDYYIDQEEDVWGGDLNFVSRYSSGDEALGALDSFVRWSLSEASVCHPSPHLHRAVVRGLLALYLSDPKVRRQGMSGEARSLIRAGRGVTRPLRACCAVVRRILSF